MSAEQDLINDLQADRHDLTAWEDEEVKADVKRRRSEVLSFRLPPEEIDQLDVAAGAVGETMSAYVRKAIEMRINGGASVVESISTGFNLVWVGKALSASSRGIAVSVIEAELRPEPDGR